MIELPEALNLAGQISGTVSGKRIAGVEAAHTPHKLVWYYGDPHKYPALLAGKTLGKATAYGGMVEIDAGDADILFGEGGVIRFRDRSEPRPAKHQLLIEFEDASALSVTVQMYAGIGAFPAGELDNKYYRIAREKPSPFSSDFDEAYFNGIVSAPEVQKLSLKAMLAAEQRIPGLGNGVLQDILFNAGLHPKRKVGALSDKEKEVLFGSVKSTLFAMASQGGRDTETDLFGNPGSYKTILYKTTDSKALWKSS
jgi:formamidopyrimidine-DNA glycosylase